MKIRILLSALFLAISAGAYAQSAASQQKYHTYDEAVAVLTAHEKGEGFQAKGGAPKIPELGEQIKGAREKHNISLMTLSYVAELSQEQLTRIENGDIVPTRDILNKIQDFLGEELVLSER